MEKKLLATIWTLATPESFRSVGDRFDMAKSTLHATFIEVCIALSGLRNNWIKMPECNTEFQSIACGFARKTGFPGVIGALDGTHVPIHGPTDNRTSYINRKGDNYT